MATTVTLFIAVLKSRAAMTRDVVRSVEAIRTLAVRAEIGLPVAVMTPQAVGASRDPFSGLRQLSLDHKRIRGQHLNRD